MAKHRARRKLRTLLDESFEKDGIPTVRPQGRHSARSQRELEQEGVEQLMALLHGVDWQDEEHPGPPRHAR